MTDNFSKVLAETVLDTLAKRRATETGESYEAAYAKVLETERGRDLYRTARPI